jgi:orotidine-5'-phosphate decarboxylase
VLTSDTDTSAFDARLEVARVSGCDGVVCSGHEIARARAVGLRTMVPGVRFAGGPTQDQARVVTPAAAVAAGADWLVIGRAVTAAPDPVAAAAALHDELAAAGAADG